MVDATSDRLESFGAWRRRQDSFIYYGSSREDWLVVDFVANGRDIPAKERSRFAAALKALGGEAPGVLEIVKSGHWANGWVEMIILHPESKQAGKVCAMRRRRIAHLKAKEDGDAD